MSTIMSTSDQVMQEEKKQTEMHKGKEEEEEKATPINGDVETNGDGQDVESKSTSHPVTNEENSSPIKSSSSPKKKASEKGHSQESPIKKKTETISESPNKKSTKSESEASPRKSTRTPVKMKSPEKSSPASKSQPRKRKADEHNESVGADSEPSHQRENRPILFICLALFEAPLVVEGKRPRHSVERLTTTLKSTGSQKKVTESTGTGITLGEIDYVATLINTHKADSLKALHRVLFNRPGTASMVKKNIRIFNGFSFDANSPEYEKKLGQLTKLSMAELKLIRSVIGVESASQKSDLVKHIIDFLMKPFDAGRRAPGSAKKAKKIRTPSKPVTSPKSSSAKKSQKKKTGKGKDEPDPDNDEQSDTSEEVEEKEPAQTIAKSTNPSPTDEELETVIRHLLKDVDLESVTMKQMCKTIFDQYPEAKLEERKSDVKTLIKKIIGESGEDN